jgi:tRNA (Thr-GGU) A37 N-methylase
MLVPHARGRIELTVEMEALDGLSEFGYVWIIFGFHLNTVGAKTRTKIAAPARGTTGRVGVLATRSPHRFNCLGITLAKLDGVELREQRNAHCRRPKRIPCLHISGHDLVDGTPVFDIKVGYFFRMLEWGKKFQLTTNPALRLKLRCRYERQSSRVGWRRSEIAEDCAL